MIYTLIVDDEPLGRQAIIQLLNPHKDISIAGQCEDGISAIEQIEKLQPDLVFMDIQMPGIDGFEVIRQLRMEPLPLIIFITAYDTFALEAFQAHAVDYLLKPVKEDQFNRALERVRLLIPASNNTDYISKIKSLLAVARPQKEYTKHLIIREKNKLLLVPLDRINILKARNDYVEIIGENERHLIRESLTHLEQKLDVLSFIRINRSTILRISMIQKLQTLSKGDHKVFLSDNQTFKLSRNYRKKVFEALQQ